MNKTKRINTYVKIGLIILLCTAVGAVLGSLSVFAEDSVSSFAAGFSSALTVITGNFQWILAVFLIVEIFSGEFSLMKIRKLGKQMKTADGKNYIEVRKWIYQYHKDTVNSDEQDTEFEMDNQFVDLLKLSLIHI